MTLHRERDHMTVPLLPDYEAARKEHLERKAALFEIPSGEFTVGELHFLMHCTCSNVDIKRLKVLWQKHT